MSNAEEQASVDEIIKLALENGEPRIGVSVAEVILVIDNKEKKSIPLPRKGKRRLAFPASHSTHFVSIKKVSIFRAYFFSINYSNVVQFEILMSFSFFFRGHSGRRKLFFGDFDLMDGRRKI